MIVVDGDAMAQSADAFRRIAQACVASSCGTSMLDESAHIEEAHAYHNSSGAHTMLIKHLFNSLHPVV